MLRNSAPGPEIGLPVWISAGLKSGKPQIQALRPAFGRPEGQFFCFPNQNAAEIRPGSPICGPEALLRNIGWFEF